MQFTRSSWKHLSGQNDVHSTLHIPMTYESVPMSLPEWEYRTVCVDTREEALLDEATLNELGSQGWLLVSVLEQSRTGTGAQVYYYFVRQKMV